jgi:hypothetical protein
VSVQSYLIGYIEEAWPGVASGGDPERLERLQDAATQIARRNDAVLNALPERDEWPPLCRPMFGWPPPDDPSIAFRSRLIHFAAIQKELDQWLRDWIDKFEGLLRSLYWESVYVRVETAYLGTYEFGWRPTDGWLSDLHAIRLRPVTEWSFVSSMDLEELNGLRET